MIVARLREVTTRRCLLGRGLADLAYGLLIASVPASAQDVGRNEEPDHTVALDHMLVPSDVPDGAGTIVIGSPVYPRIDNGTGQSRFDPSSRLLVNTLAARTGLFGAAARDGVTWANRYVPGTDLSDVVQLYALSTSGNYGAFFGARSSDNRSSGPENVIGSVSLVVADGDRPHLHWARYSEGFVPRGQTEFRLLINDENSIQNQAGPAPGADPYSFNPQHLLNNLRLDCGIGLGEAYSCTNPLSILNNGASYRTGIIFGDRSLEMVDGLATAVALPADYALSWYGASGPPSWNVYSTARQPGAGRVTMSDDSMSVEIGVPGSSSPALQITRDAIAAPAIVAAGSPPALSGSCAADRQAGGATAGTFTLEEDCTNGTIVIGFQVTAPAGWACFATDLTRSDGRLRQSAYERTSVTLAVTGMKATDAVVFSCTAF